MYDRPQPWERRPAARAAASASTRRGHTLAELMITIFILVLFGIMVMPRFVEATYRQKLDSAMNKVRSDLDYARARSISTGLRHQFQLSQDTGQIKVMPFRPEEQTGDQANAAASVPEQTLNDRLSGDVKVVQWEVTPMAGVETTKYGTDVMTMYPEGVSDSALLVLEDGGGNRRGLQLNGFNGELRELTTDEIPKR